MRRLTELKQEVVALGTFVKLIRAAESVSADVHKEIGEAGLTISQFGILEALFHLGPMSQKEIGAKILKSAGNITMVIDNLEKRKLVARTRGQTDRRSYQVSLTDKGENMIKTIFPLHSRRINNRMSVLTVDEAEGARRTAEKTGSPSGLIKRSGIVICYR